MQPVTGFVLSDAEQDITATQGGTADTSGTPADILSEFMPVTTAGTTPDTTWTVLVSPTEDGDGDAGDRGRTR